MLYLKLLGSPSLEGDGRPITGRVTQRHRVALLALLAVAPDQRLSRDKLLAYLWPETDSEKGRNLLNVSSYVIRTALGEGALLSGGDDLRLNVDVVQTDVAEFEVALARRDHTGAVAIYKGPFLDGFFLGDAPGFEQWVDQERARFHGAYAKALEALAEEAEREPSAAKAVEWWKSRAAHDPYDSRVAFRLVQALEASGNRAGALQHASVHERLLKEEFGVAPPAEIAALVERMRAEPAAGSRASIPPAVAQPQTQPPPASAHLPPVPVGGDQPDRPPRWLRIAAVCVLVSLAAVVWALWPRNADSPGLQRSIVVLPFINMSPDKDQDYFSDGLTEEIIAHLSAVPALRVISRSSAMHFKGSEKSLQEIAGELDVAHVLQGSVRYSDGLVRISAQLADVRAGGNIWAKNYDYPLRNVFRVQQEIAGDVVRALALELGERGHTFLVKQGTADAQAHQFYLRGRYLWNTRTREGHEQAVEYYLRAIERDSAYADAYAGLADAYLTAYQLNYSSMPEAEAYSRAMWAAERALAFDDLSADAHVSFANALRWQRNWPGAEREFRRAIQLNPSHATARSWYSVLLAGWGRSDEATREGRRAYELDPFAVVPSSNVAWHCYLARDYDCAIEQHLRTAEIAPTWASAYRDIGFAYAQKGMADEAMRAVLKAIELSPERPDFLADLAYVHAIRGQTTQAREILRRAKQQPREAFNIALAHVALREPDSAFAWLERSSWEWPLRAVRSEPALDPLRGDPRFARLSARIERQMGIR